MDVKIKKKPSTDYETLYLVLLTALIPPQKEYTLHRDLPELENQ